MAPNAAEERGAVPVHPPAQNGAALEEGNTPDGMASPTRACKRPQASDSSSEVREGQRGGSSNATSAAPHRSAAEEDASARPASKRVRPSCPYLGTIDKHLLDFDFEKVCSVCLSNQHVYACLVCGKYFQGRRGGEKRHRLSPPSILFSQVAAERCAAGRGKSTFAFTHALEQRHFVYLNLSSCKVYCLPDNYEVQDYSLQDIIVTHFSRSDQRPPALRLES